MKPINNLDDQTIQKYKDELMRYANKQQSTTKAREPAPMQPTETEAMMQPPPPIPSTPAVPVQPSTPPPPETNMSESPSRPAPPMPIIPSPPNKPPTPNQPMMPVLPIKPAPNRPTMPLPPNVPAFPEKPQPPGMPYEPIVPNKPGKPFAPPETTIPVVPEIPVLQNAPVIANIPVITPNPPATALQQAYDNFLKKNPYTGTLKVQVFTARRAYPVANAEVEISKNFPEGSYIIGVYTTNDQGLIPILKLPTPSKDLSFIPDNDEQAFATYDVKVRHKDFIEMHYRDVPIFQDIMSLQAADMTPKPLALDGQEYIEIQEEEPSDL